jgi:hypothetical protein
VSDVSWQSCSVCEARLQCRPVDEREKTRAPRVHAPCYGKTNSLARRGTTVGADGGGKHRAPGTGCDVHRGDRNHVR